MQEIRYIENPFFKVFNIINPDLSKLYSLMLNLLKQFFSKVAIPTTESLLSTQEKEIDISGYTGTGGYLYLFIRLIRYFQKRQNKQSEGFLQSKILEDVELKKLTDPNFYLALAIEQYKTLQKYILSNKQSNRCFSFLMSSTLVYLCGMHLGYITRNHAMFRANEERIREAFHSLKQNEGRQDWELLYGVPGFLYVVLELQKEYDKLEEELYRTSFGPFAVELTHMIIRHGMKNYEQIEKNPIADVSKLPDNFRLIYKFGKREYLGAAHGVAGNLNIILTAIKLNDFGEDLIPIMSIMKGSIHYLLKHFINGNFSTANGSINVKLVHFCHGAPGVVTALAKFMEVFPEMGLTMGLKEVIHKSLEHIWQYGVLKKGFGLCHGISGNAYAFISPSLQQIFPEKVEEYTKKAQLFALLHEEKGVLFQISNFNFADRKRQGFSDHPYSLMTGIAGDICFAIDVMEGVGHFPGYDI